MSIRLICVCGRAMSLPEKYAGEHVQCPDCHAMLLIPSLEEDRTLTRWICACGQRLKARPRSQGRKVRCPRCSAQVSVPFQDDHSAFIEKNFPQDGSGGAMQSAAENSPRDAGMPGEGGARAAESPRRSAEPPTNSGGGDEKSSGA